MQVARDSQVHLVRSGVRVAVAALVLGAAGLKLTALESGTPAGSSILDSAYLQMAVIVVEVGLGGWLVSGRAMRWALIAGMAVFGAFADVSLYLALAGKESCGCFGALTVNPWFTLALDVGTMGALAVCFAGAPTQTRCSAGARGLAAAWACAVVLETLVAIGLLFGVGDVQSIPPIRPGAQVTVAPEIAQVGSGSEGEQRVIQFELHNRGAMPVRITDCAPSCVCIAPTRHPFTLQPGESRTVEARIMFAGSPGIARYRLTWAVEGTGQATVTAEIRRAMIIPGPG